MSTSFEGLQVASGNVPMQPDAHTHRSSLHRLASSSEKEDSRWNYAPKASRFTTPNSNTECSCSLQNNALESFAFSNTVFSSVHVFVVSVQARREYVCTLSATVYHNSTPSILVHWHDFKFIRASRYY